MFKLTVFVAIIASVAAFQGMPRTTTSSKLSMSAEGLVGALPPTGYFDPLGITKNLGDSDVKKIREAELKHGRLAMLASLGILVGEKFNPLFDGKITGPAIYQFQQADNLYQSFWCFVLMFVGMVEGRNILIGWETLPGASVATLKEDYVNGDVNFDPLGLMPSDEAKFDELRTKELQNGRLAMLGVAGMVAQELVNNKSIFENLGL
mmetsp:Transcript_9072/g.23720  ORF Transcript_9072/g.23720 Transcript_9072/m.23720 type:complete len:207 (-) Transcript_9072:144-764(-)|eukprot:CAMPEP_0117519578 /NCGR_PEP_ID=MMETSP0784-20121206/32722_1 /TAXON_ID=39447 /ORGANISM="" /LENGTH=206 /DNA_ID=CAMNT_0005315539 /DNA_START=43 /DNA_END=663 /DNA_ORIENTATION=+